MTGGRSRRVLAVRCPAWDASDETAGQPPGLREFERVVSVIGEFCPRIEVLRPGICAFEARGPASYFGGEPALATRLTETVTGLGFDCGAGVADGMFAALLAARDALTSRPAGTEGGVAGTEGGVAGTEGGVAGTEGGVAGAEGGVAGTEGGVARTAGEPGPAARIEPAGREAAGAPIVIVPPGATSAYLAPRLVTVLGEPELADLLIRLGIRTLGEFAALPAAEVASRFGPPGLLAHRVARGLDPRPLVARPPSADLSVQVEFDPPAERAERVVFAAKSLAGQMHAKLAASGLACVRMQVQVSCADGQEIARMWRHDGLLTDLAVAERVRWQLDGWQAARGAARGDGARDGERGDGERGVSEPDDEDVPVGGISLLRLIPDQLVREQGRQLGLWGDAVVSDRVARAAIRVQAMLGHGAVRQPVLTGGRGPADQVLPVPFGEPPPPARPADRPWPGRIPPPSPATVYPVPRLARVTDRSGEPVTVTGRGHVSAEPARLAVDDGPPLDITAWTGPWPVTERWWDPTRACRKARFQLVTVDGSAWLAFVADGRWLIEASYD